MNLDRFQEKIDTFIGNFLKNTPEDKLPGVSFLLSKLRSDFLNVLSSYDESGEIQITRINDLCSSLNTDVNWFGESSLDFLGIPDLNQQILKERLSVKWGFLIDELRVFVNESDSFSPFSIRLSSPELYEALEKALRMESETSRDVDWGSLTEKLPEAMRSQYQPSIVTRDDRREYQRDVAESEAELKEEFKRTVEDVKNGTTPDAQDIRALIALFGGSGFVDILLLHHPNYEKLGADYVKGVIAEYLGDFLVNTPPHFYIPPDIELPKAIPPDLEDMLFSNLKNSALTYCNQRKREGAKDDELDMVLAYLASMEEQLNSKPYLLRVKERAIDYYSRLFHDLHKPDSMVDCLSEGRSFPDLNQRVNIMELAEQRQLLIADEMGLGKSNSAISAREFLGLGRTLVAMPSNVLSTWKDYLSDTVDKNGKQVGYFKTGQAPKVLEVDTVADLQKADISQFDYVLISQEKLGNGHFDTLLELDFDYMIIDEVHKLKNIKDGKRSKAAIRLAEKVHAKGGYLALLSGTPVPNKLEDVAVILRLLYPQRYQDLTDTELIQRIIYGDLLALKADLRMRMQMKEVAVSIELPERNNQITHLDFSPQEAALYQALLEEDELTATQKIRLLRRYCINHQSMEVAPEMPSTKLEYLNQRLRQVAQAGGSAVVYVNDLVEGVLRKKVQKDEADDGWSAATIFDYLDIDPRMSVCIIDGNVSKDERDDVQRRLNVEEEQMLVFVHGAASDVGVSFVGATDIFHVNDPWTISGKRQQIARIHRPGLEHPVNSETLYMNDSFDVAQYEYMQLKERAILKLLSSIPLSKMEEYLLKDDLKTGESSERNPQLAKEYLSKVQRFYRLLGASKEAGESRFKKYLETEGEYYADVYREMGTRSYQANNTRATARILRAMAEEKGQSLSSLHVLDAASGPKMLHRHAQSDLANGVISMDINPHHYEDLDKNNCAVASFLNLPVQGESLDYLTMGLAFHYTRLVKKDADFERVEALIEMNRVLKVGGSAVITLPYSMEIHDEVLFKKAVEVLGFKVSEKYTGEATSGRNYSANFITLEKARNLNDGNSPIDKKEIFSHFKNGNAKGLKFKKRKHSLKKQSNMIGTFSLNGSPYRIDFNAEDQCVKDEETVIMDLGHELLDHYGKASDIPLEELERTGFYRFKVGKNTYRIFKSMETTSGVILI